jgi:hypothetical protein
LIQEGLMETTQACEGLKEKDEKKRISGGFVDFAALETLQTQHAIFLSCTVKMA